MKKICFLFSFFIFSCQPKADMNILQQLIYKNKKELGAPAEDPEKFELQIIYTQVDRDQNNTPTFTTHHFNLDDDQYFYPASTVKMPAAFLTLEKLNRLKIKDLDKHTPFRVDSVRAPQTKLMYDSTAQNGWPTMAHLVKKIFLVSDNDAHNRMYEFLGQEYFNEELQKKGFNNTKIVHRIGPSGFPFDFENNKYTNPFTFYEGDSIVYKQSEAFAANPPALPKMKKLMKGKGYVSNGNLVAKPKDFSQKNRFALADMEQMLRAVIFPEATPERQRFDLTQDDYQLLYKVMGMRPRESQFPRYTKKEYDSYVKFFMYGDSEKPMPDHIRIFNKVGWAYGYLSDAAYIIDLEKNIEFFLAAVIHVNANQIFNDDNYEYETIGLPFLSKLGKVVYDYEVKRERAHVPDLAKFRIGYSD